MSEKKSDKTKPDVTEAPAPAPAAAPAVEAPTPPAATAAVPDSVAEADPEKEARRAAIQMELDKFAARGALTSQDARRIGDLRGQLAAIH